MDAKITFILNERSRTVTTDPDRPLLVIAGAPENPPAESAGKQASSQSKTFDLLMEVELPVSVSFGHVQLPLRDVLKLTAGSIVELNRMVDRVTTRMPGESAQERTLPPFDPKNLSVALEAQLDSLRDSVIDQVAVPDREVLRGQHRVSTIRSLRSLLDQRDGNRWSSVVDTFLELAPHRSG